MNNKIIILFVVLLIIFGVGFYTVSKKNSPTNFGSKESINSDIRDTNTEGPQPVVPTTPTQAVDESTKTIDAELQKLTDDSLLLDDL